MQNHFYKWIFVMGYLFFHSAAQAKTVVLVHGFQGDKTSWYKHGTVDALLKARWIDLTPLNDEQIRQIPLSKNAFVSIVKTKTDS